MFLYRWPCVMQHDSSDCAAAAISTVMLRYKKESTIMKIREIIGTDSYGTTVRGVVDGLEKMHFNVKAIRTNVDELTPNLTYPAIAHVKTEEGLHHFVVIHKVTRHGKFVIADPANGVLSIDKMEFKKLFLGIIIFMIPTTDFEKMKIKNKGMFNLFLKLMLPQKRMLAVIILASLLMTGLGIISSFFSKIVMDEIIPYELKNSLFIFIIIFIFLTLVQNLVSTFRQHILLFLSRKLDIPILMGYYDHIINLPYKFFGSRKTGDIIQRFQDAMTIKNIFTNVAITITLDISLALISGIVLWNLNSNLFLILLVMVIINIILIYFFKKPYRKLNYQQMEAGAMLNSQLIDSIRSIDTVKAHGNEKEQIDRLEKRFVNTLKIEFKEGVLQNWQGFASSFTNSSGNILLIGFGALFIIDGNITIGDLLVFQTLSQFFMNPMQNLVNLQIVFQEAQVAMNRLNELMSLNREDTDEDYKLDDIDLKEDITINNITFGYDSRPPVLQDFKLHIAKGDKIALVGESGAGKSTIAKLLLKFIEPSKGEIKFGNYNISDINHKYLRKKIAYIPQTIDLFTGTIIENVKVGNPIATYEEIISACKLSGAADFIDKLPNRYESNIEEGGGNLSGGEKQRLAIARALVAKSDIYIFDEATSHLDSFSEKKIQDFIFDKIKGKTTIMIAHRLSTILKCDKIFFLEKGTIVESGTHDYLMSNQGKYYELIKAQSSEIPIKNMENVPNSNINNDDDGVMKYE